MFCCLRSVIPVCLPDLGVPNIMMRDSAVSSWVDKFVAPGHVVIGDVMGVFGREEA